MAIYRTGVAAFDNAALSAERTRQASLAVAGLTAGQARAADVAWLQAIIAAGITPFVVPEGPFGGNWATIAT